MPFRKRKYQKKTKPELVASFRPSTKENSKEDTKAFLGEVFASSFWKKESSSEN